MRFYAEVLTLLARGQRVHQAVGELDAFVESLDADALVLAVGADGVYVEEDAGPMESEAASRKQALSLILDGFTLPRLPETFTAALRG
jgi:hypothetical protein